MRTTLVVATIIALIALGLFGFLYLLDKNADLDREVVKEDPKEEIEILEPALVVSAEEVFPGGSLAFAVVGVEEEPQVLWGNEEVPTLKTASGFVGVIGIPLSYNFAQKELMAQLSSGEKLKKEISLQAKEYRTSQLAVPKKASDAGKTTSTLVSGIGADDNQKIASATRTGSPEALFSSEFVIPTGAWVDVGEFGVLRKTGNSSIRHLGTDLEARVGDPVFSINRGKVVLSEYLTNYGHTLIIDHGQGIWSLYLHLSKGTVGLGEVVERGQKIAEAGDTGLYSFEPHLHFSIRVRGSSIDPKAFIDSFNKIL